MNELKDLGANEQLSMIEELKGLNVHERIDTILNIINRMPLHGFDQWNPASEAMKALAALSNDLKELEQKYQPEDGTGKTETE